MNSTLPRLTAVLIGGAVLAATSLAGTAAVAAPATTTADAGRLMLVMDASGSMGEQLPGGTTKMTAARAALHDLAGSLPAGQSVGLRVFGAKESKGSGNACTDSQRVVDLGTGNRGDLDTAIDKVQPFGETPIGYALQQAASDLGGSGQRTVVLVSDGEPTCTPDPCTVAAGLAKDGVSLRVDVVGLAVSGAARSKLQCIAAKGDGHYYDADSADDLAGALDQAAVRAATPFRTSGKPITGSNTRVNAPSMAEGDWIDTLGGVGTDRQTLYYVVHRRETDSTLHVSVDTIQTGETDYLGVALLDSEGTSCASDLESGSAGLPHAVIAASVSIPRSLDASDLHCAAAGDFVVKVDHGIGSSTSAGRRADIPIELRVREEPAVKDVQSLPETAQTPDWADPDLSGAPVKTVGGSSLNAATVLKAGTYSGSITTGEVQAFAVDLQYGQSLAAAARVSISPLLGQRLSSGGWPTMAVEVLSPSRLDAAGGSAFDSDAADHSRWQGSVYQGSDGKVFYEYTNTVNYRNRFVSAPDLRGASEAGRYLVVVSMPRGNGDTQHVTVPFVMGIGVRGDVSGVPAYTTTGSSTVDDQQATDQSGSGQTAGDGGTASQSDRAVGPFDVVRQVAGVGAVTLGGLALMGGLVLLVVLLRRRAARS